MLWALVPAKLGSTMKTRLGATLTPEERADLAQAMLTDVLDVLREVSALDAVAVVTRDDAVAELAARLGAFAFPESGGQGLNAAVGEGVASCIARGATGVVIVMGDLPLLRARDVTEVVERMPHRGVVIVPSLDATGTNVLALRPPDALPTSFGPGSLALHRRAAENLGLPATIVPLRGAALDVDTVDDLACLLESEAAGSATRDVLRRLARPRAPSR